MLMGIGSFATIAVKQPKNLKIIVIDNEHYGETGMQPAHSGRGVDIAGIAAACGFPAAYTISTQDELDQKAEAICTKPGLRSEEHTSELQSLMRISYAVFCL